MVNQRWTLGLAITIMAIFAAGDAHALKAYVSEDAENCCASKAHTNCGPSASANHQVGRFALTGVAQDKPSSMICALKPGRSGSGGATCPVTHTVGGAANVLAGPVILTGAIVNDVYLALTMPYRKSETMN